MARRLQEFLLAFSSALFLVLPFHWGEFGIFAYFAFIPFFLAINKKTPSEAFGFSYLVGILFYLMLGYWLTLVTIAGYLLLTVYLAAYFAVFGWLTAYFLNPSQEIVQSSFKQNIRSLFFIPAFWAVLEYARTWMISGMPWSLLGYSQWKMPLFIQIADITGVYGVSYFIVLINLILFRLMKELFFKPRSEDSALLEVDRQHRMALLGVLAGTLFLVAGYGMYQIHAREAFYRSNAEKAVLKISVVQGNIPQEQKWDSRIKNIIFEKYKRLTLMSALERSDLIIWPETSFPGYLEDEPQITVQLRSMVRSGMTYVLVGAPTLGNMDEGLHFFNSAILFGPDGEEIKRYSKIHLVPFGEYVPFETIFGVIRHFVHIGKFDAGKSWTLFEIKSRYQKNPVRAQFGTLICYEDIFPSLVRRFCRSGADFLVNMTNDAWFGDTTAPYQHAQASIFRAVENRVPVIRSTNTGLSCFISAEGKILSSVQDKGKEILVSGHKGQEIILRKGMSFYTRFGDIFMFVMFVLCYFAFRQRIRHSAYSRV
jgi:apolipoprotein N-acyltransferase